MSADKDAGFKTEPEKHTYSFPNVPSERTNQICQLSTELDALIEKHGPNIFFAALSVSTELRVDTEISVYTLQERQENNNRISDNIQLHMRINNLIQETTRIADQIREE